MGQLNPQNYTHLAPVNLNPKHSKNSLFILSVTHICGYADGTAMVRQAGTAHLIFGSSRTVPVLLVRVRIPQLRSNVSSLNKSIDSFIYLPQISKE